MKKKGFTLIELLVVISIIALLMAILMPALSKVRQIAQRVVCGHHLSGLGNAIELYATDHQGKYPRAGGRYSVWGESILKWNGGIPPQQNTEDIAYGVAPGVPPGRPATIGSCLFLLIKYTDASPRQFVCGGDNTATVFNLADYPVGTVRNNDVMEAWDFCGRPDGTSHSPNVE
jgi:prepilin-type N-terminal cleavage/methylation domain-containing protein